MDLSKYKKAISRLDTVRVNGRVAQVVGVLVESRGPACGVGSVVEISCGRTEEPVLAEETGESAPGETENAPIETGAGSDVAAAAPPAVESQKV